MCFQNYQDYANDKTQYIKADSVMTVDLRSYHHHNSQLGILLFT